MCPMIFAQGTSLILDEAYLSVQEDLTVFEQGTGPVSPSPPTPQMKGTLNCPKPHPNGSVGIFLSWEYVEPIVSRRCTAAGPRGKKEGSRRLVLDFEPFQGLYSYIKLKPTTTPNFNHWGVLFSIILYLGFMLVNKNHGVYHAGKEVVLTKPLDHSAIPKQMHQGRLR